jgi:fatty-acyl-CoA synthase
MQDDFPLTITAILEHGSRVFGRSECVTWQGGGEPRRTTYAEVAANARRLAAALTTLGVTSGERVATLSWNNQEHLEAYYAVPGMGAVLHTLNLRLPPAQLAHIVNHAEDKVVLVDATLVPLLAAIWAQVKTVEHVVVVGDADTSALTDVSVHRYADLLAAEEPVFVWPELDEKSPASMCYTSGTTGDPKGVVYSHRSTFLHALGNLGKTVLSPSESDRGLVVVPMFHVNAWGIPYVALLSGMSMVMPGPHMTPDQLCAAIAAERCTRSRAAARRARAAGLGNDRDVTGRRHGAPAGRGRAGFGGRAGLATEVRSPAGRRPDADHGRRRQRAALGRRGGRRDGGPRPVDHRWLPPRPGAGEVPRRLAADR